MAGAATVIDISRLLTGLRFARPTGIERMELGYALHLGRGEGVVQTPVGPRSVGPALRQRIAATAHAHWQENATAADAEAAAVLGFIDQGVRPQRSAPRRRAAIGGLVPGLLGAAFRTPERTLPQGSPYLHASFFRLERPGFFDWLERRRDVRGAFVLYDLLPVQHPEFFRPGEDALHAARLATAARFGRVLIAAAETVAEGLRDHLRRAGLPVPPIRVAPLPVEDIFAPAPALLPGVHRPFFVVCGTIEPRKNHRLLLDVWTRLVAEMGTAAPALVIAGRRGWRNEDVFRRLDDLGPLAPYVLEAPDLSSGALALLMRQASGLLSPSLGEGYGLPVAEGLASGIQVVAAATPVYRELWTGRATLIAPGDIAGWFDQIAALCRRDPALQLNAEPAHAMRWPQHIDWIEDVLADT